MEGVLANSVLVGLQLWQMIAFGLLAVKVAILWPLTLPRGSSRFCVVSFGWKLGSWPDTHQQNTPRTTYR